MVMSDNIATVFVVWGICLCNCLLVYNVEQLIGKRKQALRSLINFSVTVKLLAGSIYNISGCSDGYVV